MQAETNHQQRKSKFAAPMGGVILILAFIGLVTLVVMSINVTRGILDNSKEKTRFERLIMPLLMLDPPAFDTIESVDPVIILQSSIWATVMGDKRNSYARNQDGSLLVPATDVEVSCVKMYGDTVKLEHRSFSDFDATCIYNSETKTYYVPSSLQNNLFTPKVEKIDKKGDVLRLTVGYVPPSPLWSMDVDGNKYAPNPDKYMVYEMKKVKNDYIISAIKYPDPGMIPQVDSSSSSSTSSSGSVLTK